MVNRNNHLKKLLALACLPLALILSSCASIIDGHSQEIMVNTSPEGANCQLTRNSAPIGNISPTPNSIYIDKTKYDITITCNKKGYETATYVDHSGSQGSTWGNVILGGGIGWAVDSASGADNKYDSPVNISLSKK